MFFIRQGATHKVVLGPAVAVGDGFTPVTTLVLTGGGAADEAEVILHDNATVVDISAYTWAAIATADGYYHLTLQSGISNTVGHMTVVINDDSLILPLRADFTVLEEAVYDRDYKAAATGVDADWTNAGRLDNLLDAVNTVTPDAAGVAPTAVEIQAEMEENGASLLDTIRDELANATDGLSALKTLIDAVPTASEIQTEMEANGASILDTLQDRLTATRATNLDELGAANIPADIDTLITGVVVKTMNTDVNDAVAQKTDAVDELVDQVWDEARSGHVAAGSFGHAFAGLVGGVAEAGTLSTTEMTTDLGEATDDHYIGRTITWITGVLAGQSSDITDYTAVGGKLAFTAVTEAAGAADEFILY